MHGRKDVQHRLYSAKFVVSLDSYRNALSKVQATPDFMYDMSQELLLYASNIAIDME